MTRCDGAARRPLARVAVLMVCGAGLAGVLAGCTSGVGSAGAQTVSAVAATGTGTAAAVAPFVSIVEPFDPGHPARVEARPGHLRRPGHDARHREVLRGQYREPRRRDQRRAGPPRTPRRTRPVAPPSCPRTARGWPRGARCAVPPSPAAARPPASASRAACSTRARPGTSQVEGIAPHEFRLKATDSTDPNALAWYTTPEGSSHRGAQHPGRPERRGDRRVDRRGRGERVRGQPEAVLLYGQPFTDKGVVQSPDPNVTTACRQARSTSSPSTTPHWPRTRARAAATSTRPVTRWRSGTELTPVRCRRRPAARAAAARCAWPAR